MFLQHFSFKERCFFVVVTSHLTAELVFTQKIKHEMVQQCFSVQLIFPSVLSAAHNTANFKAIATGAYWQSKCINYMDRYPQLSALLSITPLQCEPFWDDLSSQQWQTSSSLCLCSVLQISALVSVTAVSEVFYFYFIDQPGGNRSWSACQISSIHSD